MTARSSEGIVGRDKTLALFAESLCVMLSALGIRAGDEGGLEWSPRRCIYPRQFLLQLLPQASHTTFMSIDYQLLPLPMGAEVALFHPSNVSFNGTNYPQTMPSWAVDKATSDTWSLWFGYPEFEKLRTVEEGNNATDGPFPESVVSTECQREIRDAIKDVHQGYWGELSVLTYDQIFEKWGNAMGLPTEH